MIWVCLLWSVSSLGMTVDEFVLQLIGLRYTEPDMTISYPGFLYLMMKLDSMICNGGRWGRKGGREEER